MGHPIAQYSSRQNGKGRCRQRPPISCAMLRAVISPLWICDRSKTFCDCTPIYGPINPKGAPAPMRPSLSIHRCRKNPAPLSFCANAAPWSSCHLIYSTVAWQYFSKEEKSQITELITTRGAESQAPLAWLRIEADGKSPGAGMRLDLWPEQKRIELGRMDFHGRWITWTAPKPRE